MMPMLALSALLLLMGAAYWWLRSRTVVNEEFRSFRCPRCSQKIRYLVEKAGRPALCPRCKFSCVLPTLPTIASHPEQADAPRVGQVMRSRQPSRTYQVR